ncbi:hypothetical protein HS1genome_0439 [Sulfodiicoccus acidiphilus]|uniref:Uncharacterized protein n=1 Tax=Sulfodiicoccus acidiphilus TaxID=1670455 RepID=A0A348B1J8_9CREN|nr:hypothetical protein HS1genome_0439 [Sulfodiicoccus acidiphilus]GGU00151.1 hypothetical protein GCM10007116_16820 [Sulfodiicoccus acidiphilus]
MAEALIPSIPSGVGAKEVGSANYVDSRIYGTPLRDEVIEALIEVEGASGELFGRGFCSLEQSQREDVLYTLLRRKSTFKNVFLLRALILEGFYSDYRDPWYQGRTAWDEVGFGGKRIDGVKKDWSFLKIYQECGGR